MINLQVGIPIRAELKLYDNNPTALYMMVAETTAEESRNAANKKAVGHGMPLAKNPTNNLPLLSRTVGHRMKEETLPIPRSILPLLVP